MSVATVAGIANVMHVPQSDTTMTFLKEDIV